MFGFVTGLIIGFVSAVGLMLTVAISAIWYLKSIFADRSDSKHEVHS